MVVPTFWPQDMKHQKPSPHVTISYNLQNIKSTYLYQRKNNLNLNCLNISLNILFNILNINIVTILLKRLYIGILYWTSEIILEVAVLLIQSNTESQANWRNRGICSKQTKNDKTSEKDLNEIQRSNLPVKEFKALVIKKKCLPNWGAEWMNTVKASKKTYKIQQSTKQNSQSWRIITGLKKHTTRVL